MNVFTKLALFILLISPLNLAAQYKFSVDVEPLKKRRLDVSYFLQQTKSNISSIREVRKKHRIQSKHSRKTRKHTYNNQTKNVRKRMIKTQKKAQHHNNGTVPFRIKLKKLING